MAFSHATELANGKLSAEFLRTLLQRLPPADARVAVRPGVGLDAAAIQPGNDLLLVKADPITFATEELGWYAVQVNANDIACLGGTPKWFLATILLPAGKADTHLVRKIFDDIARACRKLGVSVVGGHTEVTHAVNQPIVSGCLIGEVPQARVLDLRTCRPGDAILMVSGIAIEATAIIAQSQTAYLQDYYDHEFIERCKRFSHDPGISVLPPARLIAETGLARGMHDPTEGGLFTALHEIADACGCGLEIHDEEILILPEAKLLCEQFGLDIRGAMASGALLVVAPEENMSHLEATLAADGYAASVVGRLTPEPQQRRLLAAAGDQPLPRFDRDEIARLFVDT